jgi:DNA polymerase I
VCSPTGARRATATTPASSTLGHFGIESVDGHYKNAMRDLALRGGPWTAEEKDRLLDYCETDVLALQRLLPRMLPGLDFGRAPLRGRYMISLARIEQAGIPMDAPALERLRDGFDGIKQKLIAETDARYGVFDGTRFVAERFAGFLARQGIPWPLDEDSGRLKLDDKTFETMATVYPAVAEIRTLRSTLSKLSVS